MDKTQSQNTRDIPIKGLFDAVGIDAVGVVSLNDNTYDFDPEDPKNSWLYGAFLAFHKLKGLGFDPKVFGTIGTGSGVDSIGAGRIFELKEIFQTDIHPNVIEIAQSNALKHVSRDTKVKTFLGNLCIPLTLRGVKVDLLYANIPNIPSEKPVWHKKASSSRFHLENSNESLSILSRWYLALQYELLQQAKNILSKNGVVLVAIGDRVPSSVMNDLFESARYTHDEIVNMYKIQTETEEVVTGYAEQEIRENIEFDFYDHEKAFPVWRDECEGKNLSVEEIKTILLPFRMSAFEALRQFQKKGRRIGHIYSIFKLTSR